MLEKMRESWNLIFCCGLHSTANPHGGMFLALLSGVSPCCSC